MTGEEWAAHEWMTQHAEDATRLLGPGDDAAVLFIPPGFEVDRVAIERGFARYDGRVSAVAPRDGGYLVRVDLPGLDGRVRLCATVRGRPGGRCVIAPGAIGGLAARPRSRFTRQSATPPGWSVTTRPLSGSWSSAPRPRAPSYGASRGTAPRRPATTPRPMSKRRPPLVMVCSACGTRACWDGVLLCEDAWSAGVRLVAGRASLTRGRGRSIGGVLIRPPASANP